MFRPNLGGLLSPQSSCTMSKYRVSPTMKMSSIAANRVGVVATAAHHSPQPVTDQEESEDLLVHAEAERAAIHVPTTSAGRNALNGPGGQ